MNNQPAFPSKQKALMIKSEHIGIASEYEIEHNGMSLRDYMAAKAMQAIMGDSRYAGVIDVNNYQYRTAEDAYKMADAMLVAREKA